MRNLIRTLPFVTLAGLAISCGNITPGTSGDIGRLERDRRHRRGWLERQLPVPTVARERTAAAEARPARAVARPVVAA